MTGGWAPRGPGGTARPGGPGHPTLPAVTFLPGCSRHQSKKKPFEQRVPETVSHGGSTAEDGGILNGRGARPEKKTNRKLSSVSCLSSKGGN